MEIVKANTAHPVARSECRKLTEADCRHYPGRGRIQIATGADCVDLASELAKKGKVCLHNFANDLEPGSTTKFRGNTQEEVICKRTTLCASLGIPPDNKYHPIDKRTIWPRKYEELGIIYSPTVHCVRDKQLRMIEPSAPFSVITIAAIDFPAVINDRYKNEHERDVTRRKIRMILSATHGETLCGGMWGCGIFANPLEIVDIWVEEIARTDVDVIFCTWDKSFEDRLRRQARKHGLL